MSNTIDQAFVKEFDSMVSVEYQRTGSKLKGAVRVKPTNNANSVRFPKYGQGEMGVKSRHGNIPLLNVEHSYVEVTVADYYGGEYIDDLDLLKTNIDERQLAAQAIANAAGRKVDDRLVDVMTDASGLDASNVIAHGSASFTKTKVLAMFENFGNQNIPDDGQRYVLVSPDGWVNGLMGITEFTNQDYIGPDMLPWATGVTAKRWLGFLFMQFTGLQIASTTRTCLAWHKPAVGLAENSDLRTNFDWVPEKAAWLAQGRISCEGVVIQKDGLMQINITE